MRRVAYQQLVERYTQLEGAVVHYGTLYMTTKALAVQFSNDLEQADIFHYNITVLSYVRLRNGDIKRSKKDGLPYVSERLDRPTMYNLTDSDLQERDVSRIAPLVRREILTAPDDSDLISIDVYDVDLDDTLYITGG